MIGDLLETYQVGRSRFWYERQVLGIVVFGLAGKLQRQKSDFILLLGAVLAAAICAWTVVVFLNIGGVFATIISGEEADAPGYSIWLGLAFFIGEIIVTALYFRADRFDQ